MITYWRGELPLAGDLGVCVDAAGLPQDETTAVVVLAAILARTYAHGYWPGCYRARVQKLGTVVWVGEDDARVWLTRLAMGAFERRTLPPRVLALTRARVLASRLSKKQIRPTWHTAGFQSFFTPRNDLDGF